MKEARKRLATQKSKFQARWAGQSMQFGKRLNVGCTRLECDNESKAEGTQDRQLWTE